jgi:drug/metabolite transporter (DMT)-like permease
MLPWLAFVACCLIWGSTWLAHKWALVDFTPIGLATLRFLCAGVLCLGLARFNGERFARREDLPVLLFSGLIMVGLANVVTAWTLLHIPSGVGAVLQAPIPVWMALLTLRTDPLRPSGWLAVFLGFLGVALVMWPEQTGAIDPVAAVVCALMGAGWSWASLLHRRRVRSGGLFANAGLQMLLSGALGVLLTPLLGGYTHGAGVSPQAWMALGYLIIAGSCIAFASYLYLAQVWHPARAGSFSYVTPAIAVLLGWIFGREALGAHLLAGLWIILLAVAVLQWATRAARVA